MDYLSKINLGGLGKLFGSRKAWFSAAGILINLLAASGSVIDPTMSYFLVTLIVMAYVTAIVLEKVAGKKDESRADIKVWLELAAVSPSFSPEVKKFVKGALDIINNYKESERQRLIKGLLLNASANKLAGLFDSTSDSTRKLADSAKKLAEILGELDLEDDNVDKEIDYLAKVDNEGKSD